jgi:hypothetical protein
MDFLSQCLPNGAKSPKPPIVTFKLDQGLVQGSRDRTHSDNIFVKYFMVSLKIKH